MSRPPVLTKADFYRRFLAGEFGNRGPVWDSWDALYRSGYRGLVMIRWSKPGSKICTPYLNIDQAKEYADRKEADELLTYSAMCPHGSQTINGELQRDHRGLCLFYSHVRKPMRESLTKGGNQAFGIVADHVLRANVHAPDYDWLMELLELYPGHVIEFTAFEICWGVVPGSQCVIWEVRKY